MISCTTQREALSKREVFLNGRASVATLKLIGVPVAAGLAATLLFRFFTFWLPMAPGLILARQETKA